MIGTPLSSCNILNYASGEILSLNSNIIISPADCHGHPRPLLASVPLATGHLIESCLATLGQRISYAYYTDLSTKCYRTSRRARGFPTRYGIGTTIGIGTYIAICEMKCNILSPFNVS